MKISSYAIDNPLYTLLAFIFVILAGIIAFTNIQKEYLPKVKPPVILVNIEYPNGSPREIESQINKELEPILSNLKGLSSINSIAGRRFSSIQLEFESFVDIDQAKREVQDQIDKAISILPDDIETPVIQTFDTSQLPEMQIALHGKNLDYITLSDYAKKVKNAVKKSPLIQSVYINGKLDREVHIDIDPNSLSDYGISLDEIIQFLQANHSSNTAGQFKIDDKQYYSRILGRFKSIDDIKNAFIRYNNGQDAIRLGDIASIKITHADISRLSRFNQDPSISLNILGKDNRNIQDVADSVYERIDFIKQSNMLPSNIQLSIVDDSSLEVKKRVNQLSSSIVIGVSVVFLVMFLTSGFRIAIISGLGIPFCCLFVFIGMFLMGRTLNNVSQIGFIITIGIIIDGAIIMIENIYRHIEGGTPIIQATKTGVDEVGSTVIASGLTTIIAFIPLLFISGVAGSFMADIPKVVILSLVGALLFDHIFIPMIAAYLLKSGSSSGIMAIYHFIFRKRYKSSTQSKSPINSKRFNPFNPMRNFAIKHPIILIGIVLFCFLGSIFLASKIEFEFFPKSERSFFVIKLDQPRGTSIQSSDKVMQQIEPILNRYTRNKDNPTGVIQYYATDVGTSMIATKSLVTSKSSNVGVIFVQLVDESERSLSGTEIMDKVRHDIDNQVIMEGYVQVIMSGGPPSGDPVNISITGDHLATLKNIVTKIESYLGSIPNIVNIRNSYSSGNIELQINIHRDKLAQYQISVKDIQRFLYILINGMDINQYGYGEDTLDIRIRVKKDYREDINALLNINFYHPRLKQSIPIRELIDIHLGTGASQIYRKDGQRIANINADIINDASVSQTMRYIQDALKDLTLPAGYSISYKGETEKRNESFASLGKAFILSTILIYMILIIQFKSILQPLIIVCVIPLSLIGVTVGMTILNLNIGVMTLFGVIALAGIVVNDSILLISYTNQLRNRGYNLVSAVLKASKIKTRPILLTTVTTIGGFIPLILSRSNTMIFWHALAWPIINGLLFASILTLVVTPIIYYLFEVSKIKLRKLILKK